VLRDFFSAVIVIAAVLQAAGGGDPQSPSSDAQPPSNGSTGQALDPAAVLFESPVGLVLHAVKPGSETSYEEALLALKDALASASDPETQKIASGWRVFKATEPDAKTNVIYVHWLDPAVAGVDYRPSLWLDKLLAGAPGEMLAKYRDAFAQPPAKLSLTELLRK
jgi:hypothetical protein